MPSLGPGAPAARGRLLSALKLPWLVAVSVSFAAFVTLVGGGAKVLGDLRLQQMLERPLDDLAQELRIVEQRPLHQLFVEPMMAFGDRLTSIDRP